MVRDFDASGNLISTSCFIHTLTGWPIRSNESRQPNSVTSTASNAWLVKASSAEKYGRQRERQGNDDLCRSILVDKLLDTSRQLGTDLHLFVLKRIVIFDGEFGKLFKTAAFRDDFLQYLIERTAKYQHLHF